MRFSDHLVYAIVTSLSGSLTSFKSSNQNFPFKKSCHFAYYFEFATLEFGYFLNELYLGCALKTTLETIPPSIRNHFSRSNALLGSGSRWNCRESAWMLLVSGCGRHLEATSVGIGCRAIICSGRRKPMRILRCCLGR